MAKAWSGRFRGDTDPRVEAFTESISFDQRLATVDIRGSRAHARMLAHVGLISNDERDQIVHGLNTIEEQITAGEFPFRQELEDIHMHIESALIDQLGDVGRKLHTGRSRNDQISTDLRLFVREAIDETDSLLNRLQLAFVHRAEADAGIVMAGYTHLQRAQPVQLAHYWMAYCEKYQRDRDRLANCRSRVNCSPLGCAALAGTSLPIDRDFTAKELGFESVAANSLDVSSDRDFIAEYLFVLSLIATHLSSWCEEWILWYSTEFGYLDLPDAYTTGSSIMPQKRNPDVLELIRGKTARVCASVPRLLFLLKSLPMAYNRDLQEDKEALFDAHQTTTACLELAADVVGLATINRDAITARLEDGFLDATALMEYLIRKGVPMRTGHETVGGLVSLCEDKSCRLADLTLNELRQACDLIEDDVFEVLGAENAMRVLSSYGSGGEKTVKDQVLSWRARLTATSTDA